MAAKRHLEEWKWISLMMLGYIRYSFTTETVFVTNQGPRGIYKAELTANRATVGRLVNADPAVSRFVYNKHSHALIWGEGSDIKKLSVNDGGPPSTISAGVTMRDIALDSMTGNIIFTGNNTIYNMNTGGIIYRLPTHEFSIQFITVDHYFRRVCFCVESDFMVIVSCVGISGSPTVRWVIVQPCKWILYHDGYFYWIDSRTIRRRRSFITPSEYQSKCMFSEKSIDYFTMFGNYIYGVSTADPNLYKININNVSDVTTFDLGLYDMTFLAVFETPQLETFVDPDTETKIVIVVTVSTIVFMVACSIVLLVKKWKHIPKHCCGENNSEGLQSQEEDSYIHAVYTLGNRADVDNTQSSIASSDHYDNIYDDLLDDNYYLTPIVHQSHQHH